MKPLLAAILIAVTSRAAIAASFDRTRASGRIERAICTDPTLSAADAALARAYQANLVGVSATASHALRDGQRQWLRGLAVACADASDLCLENFYTDRVWQLSTLVQHKGGLTFYVVERITSNPLKPDDTTRRGVMQDIGWPRIDAPTSDDQRAWNAVEARAGVQTAAVKDDNQDASNEFTISLVTPRLISVEQLYRFYDHGFAHGHAWGLPDTRLLAERRVLRRATCSTPGQAGPTNCCG